MGRRVAIALAALSLAIAAAAHGAKGYRSVLSGATRSGKLYSAMTWDAKIIWHATFMDDEMRAAYGARAIRLKHMDDGEAAAFLDDEAYRQSRAWEFYIGMYAKKDYKEFSMDSDSFWKIGLATESGGELKPISIEPIPVSPFEREMFPYLDRWSRLYRVSFPKVPLGERFSLTMMSVVGESTLTWHSR